MLSYRSSGNRREESPDNRERCPVESTDRRKFMVGVTENNRLDVFRGKGEKAG